MAPPSYVGTLLAATLIACNTAAVADLTGRPRVIDGSTLEIAGQHIDLAGIRAPAAHKLCGNIRCGMEAAFTLAETIEQHWVECTFLPGSATAGAICRIGGQQGRDVNAAMVSSGWAVATDSRYALEEAAARKAGLGLWAR